MMRIADADIASSAGWCMKFIVENDHAIFVFSVLPMSDMIARACAASACRRGACSNPRTATDHAVRAILCAGNDDIIGIEADASADRRGVADNLKAATDHERLPKFRGHNDLRFRSA